MSIDNAKCAPTSSADNSMRLSHLIPRLGLDVDPRAVSSVVDDPERVVALLDGAERRYPKLVAGVPFRDIPRAASSWNCCSSWSEMAAADL